MIYIAFSAILTAFCFISSIDDWEDRRVNKKLAYLFIVIGFIAVLLNFDTLSLYYSIASIIIVFASHFVKAWWPFDSVICLLLMLFVCCSAVPEVSLIIPAIPLFIVVLIKISKRKTVPIIPFLTIGFILAVTGVFISSI